jgi:hypothetical protein
MLTQSNICEFCSVFNLQPIPVATRFKAWVCVHSLAGISDYQSRWKHGGLSDLSVVCCQVEVSASS